MSVPQERITVTPDGVTTDYLSPAQREREAKQAFNQAVSELGIGRQAFRDFCREQLGFKKEGSRSIKTAVMSALFLLSENRCPIDGLELVPDITPESSEYVCPKHHQQTGYYYSERGDQVINHLSPALLLVETGLLYPNVEGLKVIEELRQQSQT